MDTIGHNKELKALEAIAISRQRAAQHAWHDLMEAQIRHDEDWHRILGCASKIGVKSDDMRRKFNVTSSTFSRWLSGFASPTRSLRTRLGIDLSGLARNARDVVQY